MMTAAALAGGSAVSMTMMACYGMPCACTTDDGQCGHSSIKDGTCSPNDAYYDSGLTGKADAGDAGQHDASK